MTVSWPHPATWAWSRGACDGHRRDCAAEASALPDVNIIDLVTVQPKRRLEAGGGGRGGRVAPPSAHFVQLVKQTCLSRLSPLQWCRGTVSSTMTIYFTIVLVDSALNNKNCLSTI